MRTGVPAEGEAPAAADCFSAVPCWGRAGSEEHAPDDEISRSYSAGRRTTFYFSVVVVVVDCLCSCFSQSPIYFHDVHCRHQPNTLQVVLRCRAVPAVLTGDPPPALPMAGGAEPHPRRTASFFLVIIPRLSKRAFVQRAVGRSFLRGNPWQKKKIGFDVCHRNVC